VVGQVSEVEAEPRRWSRQLLMASAGPLEVKLVEVAWMSSARCLIVSAGAPPHTRVSHASRLVDSCLGAKPERTPGTLSGARSHAR